ncbi:efflux RND transporter periplasmic adaptor subunit [Alginatibacterium sediminis]|nr:efflux RND transporter periplasmic adaptor subunit [Alginatibacterium sediminis]
MAKLKHLFLVLSLLMLSACEFDTALKSAPTTVYDSLVIGEAASDYLREFKGQVVPAELTKLSFRVDGELQSISVKPGDRVVKGQILASLNVEKIEQELLDLNAQRKLANRQLKRGRDLSKNKMISASDIDVLIANQKLVTIAYKSAQRRLEFSSIRAPFDGLVSQVPKQSFERVSPGEMVISIYQEQQVYVRLSVSDTVLALINPDPDPSQYQPKAYFDGHKQPYALSYLEHTSERHPQTQNYEVWLQMPQTKPAILPGTAVTIEVDLLLSNPNLPPGFQVPLSVLVAGDSPGQFKVWKVINGKAKASPVDIGRVDSHGVLITGGLTKSDVLLSSKLRSLREDKLVTIKEGTL